jgi:hypothetical protein
LRILLILCLLAGLALFALWAFSNPTSFSRFWANHPRFMFVFAWLVLLSTCALILWRVAHFFIGFVKGWQEAEAQPRGFDVLEPKASDPQVDLTRHSEPDDDR